MHEYARSGWRWHDEVRETGIMMWLGRMMVRQVSGILPGYSFKEGRIAEDGLLVEFPCTLTRTRSMYSY
jgi:hypothetical protein